MLHQTHRLNVMTNFFVVFFLKSKPRSPDSSRNINIHFFPYKFILLPSRSLYTRGTFINVLKELDVLHIEHTLLNSSSISDTFHLSSATFRFSRLLSPFTKILSNSKSCVITLFKKNVSSSLLDFSIVFRQITSVLPVRNLPRITLIHE